MMRISSMRGLLDRGCVIPVALLAALVLSGCSSMLNFTPERAVVEQIASVVPGGIQADRDTLQVLQTQMLGGEALVLVRFEGVRAESGQRDACLYLYSASRDRLGWRSGGGGGGCSPAAQPDETGLSVSMGQHSGSGLNYSEVDGLVFAPDILSVQVTWEDGETQNVEVVNESYLVVRTGAHDLQRLEGLNEAGEVIFNYEQPQNAPAKEEVVVPDEEG